MAGTHGFNFGEPEINNDSMEERSESIEETVAKAADMGIDQSEQSDLSMEWRLTYSRAARNEPDTRETIYEDNGRGEYIFRDSSQSGSRSFFDLEDHDYTISEK